MTEWSVSFAPECLRLLDLYRVSTAKVCSFPIHATTATSSAASNPLAASNVNARRKLGGWQSQRIKMTSKVLKASIEFDSGVPHIRNTGRDLRPGPRHRYKMSPPINPLNHKLLCKNSSPLRYKISQACKRLYWWDLYRKRSALRYKMTLHATFMDSSQKGEISWIPRHSNRCSEDARKPENVSKSPTEKQSDSISQPPVQKCKVCPGFKPLTLYGFLTALRRHHRIR